MPTKPHAIYVFFFALSVALQSPASAQTESSANTPEEVAETYCRAITNKNSELLLSVINESAGKQFGEEILKSIKELQAVGELTLSHEFFGNALKEKDLAALTWQDALATMICGPAPSAETGSTKTRFRSSTWRMNPNWIGGLRAPGKRIVIGVVNDKLEPELAHIVYRYEGMNPRPHEDFVNLLTCYREDDRWGIVFPMKMRVSFMLRVQALKSQRNQAMQRSGGGGVPDDG